MQLFMNNNELGEYLLDEKLNPDALLLMKALQEDLEKLKFERVGEFESFLDSMIITLI